MAFPIDAFVTSLTEYKAKDVFNPWTDVSEVDINDQMPSIRRKLLTQHLSCATPRLIIVNDSSSYYGSRQTGVPLTSEYLILNNRIPRVTHESRMTDRPNTFNDPAAGFFWQLLHRHQLAHQTLCWDLLPFQPFRESTKLNRAPTKEEIKDGRVWLHELLLAFPNTPLLGVGARVRDAIGDIGIRKHAFVPHPGRGGTEQCEQAITDFAAYTTGDSAEPETEAEAETPES